MKTVTIHEAKTNLSRLIEKACRGEEIIIAHGPDPVVRLVPIGAQGAPKAGHLEGEAGGGAGILRAPPAGRAAAMGIKRCVISSTRTRFCGVSTVLLR